MTNKSDGGCGVVCDPEKPKTSKLPPWKVLLHNDDVNHADYVTTKVQELTALNEQDAVERVMEAHKNDVALLLTTHQERAELYVEQFQSCKITVTAEEA